MTLSKVLLTMVAAVSMSIALISCGGGGGSDTSTPGGAATAAVRAMASGNVDAMKRWMQPKEAEKIPDAAWEFLAAGASKEVKDKGGIQSVEVVKTEMVGDDKANVTMRVKLKNDKAADEDVMKMVKIDGKWYVESFES